MKILYSWGVGNIEIPAIKQDLKEWKNAGFDITSLNHYHELGINRVLQFKDLDRLYVNKDKALFNFYDKVRGLLQTHDVLIVNYTNVYHPEFIKSLKNIYTVLISGDDPDSSNRCSKPYVHAFDHCFSWGVYFDKDKLITEKFLEWGAKRVDRWLHGVNQNNYDISFKADDIYTKERDIDLVYVGYSGVKVGRLAKIKQAFPQMQVYGRGWRWMDILSGVVFNKDIDALWRSLISGLWITKKLPIQDLIPLYHRAKIGINMPLTFGVGNQRLFHLPANGVMQVCDNAGGLNQVFELDKEVIGYDTTNEAIELIRYYLEHDKERKEIAVAGFNRTMKDYQRVITFTRAIEKIKQGMLSEGIRIM